MIEQQETISRTSLVTRKLDPTTPNAQEGYNENSWWYLFSLVAILSSQTKTLTSSLDRRHISSSWNLERHISHPTQLLRHQQQQKQTEFIN